MVFNPDNPNEHEEWKEKQEGQDRIRLAYIHGSPDQLREVLEVYEINGRRK